MIYSRYVLSQNLEILMIHLVFLFFLSGDAVPKFSPEDSVPDEPRLLLYLNREVTTSVQTG